jgi:hypothetical protein
MSSDLLEYFRIEFLELSVGQQKCNAFQHRIPVAAIAADEEQVLLEHPCSMPLFIA